MGSTDPTQDELTVLVTGFGPFKQDFPVNPSWEITKDLPNYLPPLRAKGKASRSSAPVVLPSVHLLVHPEPIRVNYETVRELVPKLWDLERTTEPDRPKIDIAIHIGMAGPRPFYCIERQAHRDGYAMKDVDNEFLRDQERRVRQGKDWVWYGQPKELLTDFDLDDVLSRWKDNSPDGLDLRISDDAGHYLCDFIYFSSLAHLHKAGEKRNVVFLHVPCDSSEQSIATGKELLLQLIRSIAESEVTRRAKLQASSKKK
ncbi:hypothetical protein B0T22DRAFT_436885 [Podospora appendiculata]|uniref:Peptidase C15, pyroglutamyl peptidase I-like protein n=1 Tax=Podospora appendiculata TaxID=314037 RepID=A0AAE0XI09_9PEZI|nr:hypothetical protein B0T22DRAFT_436885 [Podospora appendiculata]